MHRCAFVITVTLAALAVGPTTAAHADSSIPCDAFLKNADGTWSVLETTYIEGPAVKVQEGAVLTPGNLIRNYDIAAMVAKACPNAQVGPPPGTPATAATAPLQQQQASILARVADANGNIDVRLLTCGQLDDAAVDEAELFLGWYSGWYNGSAKGHGINLARVRYTIRNVIDYCKGNRDKRLADVMQLMLK